MSTGIEWTEETWNPVTGCSKVSAGCQFCYAAAVARRFWPTQYPVVLLDGRHPDAIPSTELARAIGNGDTRPRAFGDVWCHAERLPDPLRWRKPRRVFVNSMSDLFHPDVPDAFIDQVFAVMALTPRHTYQVLTKRPERMHRYVIAEGSMCSREAFINGEIWSRLGTKDGNKIEHGGNWRCKWPLPNVWLGVSVENQETADKRIPLLLQTPAALRFVSCEPLLGPIDLNTIDTTSDTDPGYSALELRDDDEGDLVETLDWVIVGGESGPKARPCYTSWIRSLIRQCESAAVPCFVKQVGARPIIVAPEPRWPGLLKNRKGGDPNEWPEDLRVRQMPEVRA
jgi:protein gp37